MVLIQKLDLSGIRVLRIFNLLTLLVSTILVLSGRDSSSLPQRKAGEKECLSCIQTGLTQLVTLPFIKLSPDTSEICWHQKVIFYIYKEPEVLKTNTCLSNKTYVSFKTGITMHLVRTFKTVELFKVPLCVGISLSMDGMMKRWKKAGCQN